jgi:TolB protein
MTVRYLKSMVMLTLIFCLVSGVLEADGQNKDWRIAFNYYDTLKKDYEIMISDMDGNNKRNITNTKGTDWTYFANGTTIYFISDRDTCSRCFFLYRMDANGGQVKKISDLQLEDSWMGSRYQDKEMVVSGRKGASRSQLYLVNLMDGTYKALTSDTSAFHGDPAFVNGGRQIAFRYKTERRNRDKRSEIWIMDDNGSNRRQLTHYPAGDTTAPWYAYTAGAPKWNEAKGFLSYQSMQKGKYHIYGITPDGKKQWQVSNTALNEGWHAWSPDGEWLVFDQFNDEQTAFDIVLLNIQSGEHRMITKGEWRIEQAPVFVTGK